MPNYPCFRVQQRYLQARSVRFARGQIMRAKRAKNSNLAEFRPSKTNFMLNFILNFLILSSKIIPIITKNK